MLDPSVDSDAGVPDGAALLRFASAAAQQGSDDLDQARAELIDAVGVDGLTEAAATVAIFSGLVRVADGTGIQLDAGALADSSDYRDRLGINNYGGAENSDTHVEASRIRDVSNMFG